MMHFLEPILFFVAGGISGIFTGFKFYASIPLRSPSNKVRLENATVDAEIAQLNVNRRKSEMELEYVEIQGQRKLEETKNEILSITQQSQTSSIEGRLLKFAKRRFPDRVWSDSITLDSLLNELEDEIVEAVKSAKNQEDKAKFVIAYYGDLVNAARRFVTFTDKAPKYLREATIKVISIEENDDYKIPA